MEREINESGTVKLSAVDSNMDKKFEKKYDFTNKRLILTHLSLADEIGS